jgi:DNA polymerase-1
MHLLLIDFANLCCRLYYRKGCATPADVVPHVRHALLGAVREWAATHLIAALDAPRCFRYDLYPEYKGHRASKDGPTAQEICAAVIPHLDAWGVQTAYADDFEADDVIATLVSRAAERGTAVSILSTDRDLFALVNDDHRVCVLYPEHGKEVVIREADVLARLGVWPQQVVTWKLLAGDKSDNIPKVGLDKMTAAGVRRYGFTPERAAEILTRPLGYRDLSEKEQAWVDASRDQCATLRLVVALRPDAPVAVDAYRCAVSYLR